MSLYRYTCRNLRLQDAECVIIRSWSRFRRGALSGFSDRFASKEKIRFFYYSVLARSQVIYGVSVLPNIDFLLVAIVLALLL